MEGKREAEALLGHMYVPGTLRWQKTKTKTKTKRKREKRRQEVLREKRKKWKVRKMERSAFESTKTKKK